jgi:hypothetical protein
VLCVLRVRCGLSAERLCTGMENGGSAIRDPLSEGLFETPSS